jgi:hypothetical protein
MAIARAASLELKAAEAAVKAQEREEIVVEVAASGVAIYNANPSCLDLKALLQMEHESTASTSIPGYVISSMPFSSGTTAKIRTPQMRNRAY